MTNTPERIVREILEECGDCDVCRHLMDGSCFFFSTLFRLWDRERGGRGAVSTEELRHLVSLCHFCALCPCEPVRSKIIQAKTAFVERNGLTLPRALLENVERTWHTLGTVPALINRLFALPCTASLVKKLLGIHPERSLPRVPEESFNTWTEREKLTTRVATDIEAVSRRETLLTGGPRKGAAPPRPKVAYFVGCTGRFLFPQVPKAFITILSALSIPVYIFDQHCCGMPLFLEGDRRRTLALAEQNVRTMATLLRDGYDVVCSCPTCTFMLREIIPSGAAYTPEGQQLLGAHRNELLFPLSRPHTAEQGRLLGLHPNLYGKIFAQEHYFSPVDPRDRLMLAQHLFDAGEYLLALIDRGILLPLEEKGETPPLSLAFFTPCHQREQKRGKPYLALFFRLGLHQHYRIKELDDHFYCCGLGGIIGFTTDYHEYSLAIAQPLVERLLRLGPEIVATECLSCRLQIEALTPLTTVHPLEVLLQHLHTIRHDPADSYGQRSPSRSEGERVEAGDG